MAAGFETTSHAITWCLTMMVSGVNQQNPCSGAMPANCKRFTATHAQSLASVRRDANLAPCAAKSMMVLPEGSFRGSGS
jgi:hypothetical protein